MKFRPRTILVFLFVPLLILFAGNQQSTARFGKNRVVRTVHDWNVMHSRHFDFYYPVGFDDTTATALQIAEEAYQQIGMILRHEPTMPIPVIFYPSHLEFQDNSVSMSPVGQETGGFTEFLKQRVVIPFTGDYRELRHVLTHELVHAFQLNIMLHDESGKRLDLYSIGSSPLWVLEGMAEYISTGYDDTADMVMRDMVVNEMQLPLKYLNKNYYWSSYQVYKQGQAFYRFLDDVYGEQAIGELLRNVRDTRDIEESLEILTGLDIDDLDRDFRRYYRRMYDGSLKGRQYQEHEALGLTRHLREQSSLNVAPAVSPDGTKIAFISNRDVYPRLAVAKMDDLHQVRYIRTVAGGDIASKYEGFGFFSNTISWSPDGRNLVFAAQSYGRECIFIVDSWSGDVVRKLELPFNSILDPRLSSDGNSVVFVGQSHQGNDVYLYSLDSGDMRRLTSDSFAERNPQLTQDGKNLVYVTNRNDQEVLDQYYGALCVMNLDSGEVKQLVSAEEGARQPAISPDGKKILYSSNKKGVYDIYCLDLERNQEERITSVTGGAFSPGWFPDGKNMVYVGYHHLGYDLYLQSSTESKTEETDEEKKTWLRQFRPSYLGMDPVYIDQYKPSLGQDYLVILGGATGSSYGWAGTIYAQMGISDYLGHHRLAAAGEYAWFGSDKQAANLDAGYLYSRFRPQFGMGVFTQSSPYGVYSLQTLNDLIHQVYSDTITIRRYGGYASLAYPFTRLFRSSLEMTSYRYERDYEDDGGKLDVAANMNQFSLSFDFDNVLWGPMAPLDGTRARIEAQYTADLSGQDHSFYSVDVDVRHYVPLWNWYSLAFRLSGGKIMGRDSEYFRYNIGGFDTLRGHGYADYSGKNMFLFNAEFRYIFIEGIKFGFPLYLGMGSIGGVLFADGGAAWDDEFVYRNSETGEFETIKADAGFGLRFALAPAVYLKLDWAWPWNYKNFGSKQIVLSLGIEY